MLIKSNYAPVLISIRIFSFVFSPFAAFIMAFQWLSSFFIMQIRSRVVSEFIAVFRCRFHFQDQTREKNENLVVRGAKDFPFSGFCEIIFYDFFMVFVNCKSFVWLRMKVLSVFNYI